VARGACRVDTCDASAGLAARAVVAEPGDQQP